MNERNSQQGFSLIELLVSTAVLGIMMIGVTSVFLTQQRSHTRQELAVAMEENLRVAEGVVVDALRGAGYGLPENPTGWMPWAGMSSSMSITYGTGTAPDSFSVAACFREPVAHLATDYDPAGGNVLTVTPASGSLSDHLDDANRRLVMIDQDAWAHVVGVSSTTLSVDADLVTAANQALARPYPVGTPICRVDVLTFSIQTDGATGVPRLMLDENHGAGAQVVAEGISDLQLTALAYGRYQVRLTAQSERRDPVSGAMLARTTTTHLSRRNY